MKDQILVVGCGSIGERHVRCLQRTGRAEVSVCEMNLAVLERIQRQYQVVGHIDLETALAARPYTGVVISTPAHTHIDLALACMGVEGGLLIEKPLSTSLDKVEALKSEAARRNKFISIAYVYHFRRNVREARQLLQRGTLGKPIQIALNSGQHFPTYRPAYRAIYYARHETGGGAIQDALTHAVNVVEWLVGPTTRVYCEAAHGVLDGVTVEDTVAVTAKNGDVLVTYSLNQFQPPNETTFLIHCERGSIKIEFHSQRWGVWRRDAVDWEYFLTPATHLDDVFVAQANAFLDALHGEPTELCNLDSGVCTLKFNLAALQSSRTGLPVEIK